MFLISHSFDALRRRGICLEFSLAFFFHQISFWILCGVTIENLFKWISSVIPVVFKPLVRKSKT